MSFLCHSKTTVLDDILVVSAAKDLRMRDRIDWVVNNSQHPIRSDQVMSDRTLKRNAGRPTRLLPDASFALGLFGLFLGFLPFSIFYRAYISSLASPSAPSGHSHPWHPPTLQAFMSRLQVSLKRNAGRPTRLLPDAS